MLPSAGYFKTILCPFFEDNHECPRTFCHYKHIKNEKSTIDKNKTKNTASSNGFSYRPTPLSLLGQDGYSEPPAYNPTPITPTKIKEEPNQFDKNDDINKLWQEIQAPSSTDKKDSSDKHSKSSSEESRSKKSKSSHHKSSKDRKDEHKSDSEKKHHKSHHHSSSNSDSSKKNHKTSEKHKKDSKHSKEHHSKSRSKDDKSSKDRRRSSDEGSGSRKSHDHHHKRKKSSADTEDTGTTTATKKSKSEYEDHKEVTNSVLSFLDAMDAIDKKLEKTPKNSSQESTAVDLFGDDSSGDEEKPAVVIKKPPKIQEASPSFLAAITKPDKILKKNVEIDTRKSRIRVSSVKSSDAGMSSTMIARKKQSNNPVQAMLNRMNKVRVESQNKDLEEQLSALTGQDLEPSSSSSKAKSFEPLEGLRKGKVQRKAHLMKNAEVLRRPAIDSDTQGKVPANVRQKYLDTITDECLKIYPNNTAAAYQRSVYEENICSNKSKTRSIYLNLVVNLIKKLRNEAKANNPSASNSADPVKKSVTPNMLTTHLQTLIGKAGTIGSWSIEENKYQKFLNTDMSSEMLYRVLKGYILTDEQLEENGYPIPSNLAKALDEDKFGLPERNCDRCQKLFRVDDDGLQIVKEECVYHWGRLRRMRSNREYRTTLNLYACCKGEQNSEGCSVNAYHITDDVDPNGFVKTMNMEDKSKEKVFAMDCEMCYTTRGIELTRVTVIDDTGDTVYETFVKPDNKILDFNTRFSGVTEKDLEGVKTTIRDVQAVLLSMFSSDTILCGHSLESDLKALKLIHTCIVDTSVVFPHKMGPPLKRALRNLTSEYLQRIIQEDVGGHDSKEDALAALDLMKYKVKEDLRKKL